MNLYYLSIETLDENNIISICWQKINRLGNPSEKMIFLNAWDLSEEILVKKFHKILTNGSKWDFVPVGNGLEYYEEVLRNKFSEYRLDFTHFKPNIDLRPVMVLMNRGVFAGSGLSDFMKIDKSSSIREWYNKKDYSRITEYAESKAYSFLNIYQDIVNILSDYGMRKKKNL